jgi:transposase
MLRALGDGVDSPAALADLARGRLRDKLPQLEETLRGVLSETQCWLLREQLRKVEELDEAINRMDTKVAESCLPFAQALAILDQIPGVNQRIAQNIVAEVGLDMSRFKTAAQLASWAGMCPGNRQSAGKSQGGKTRKGNGWLRQALVEAAWAASRAKGSSLQATYHRVAGRRGGKRACLAVGHRILRMVHTLLSTPRTYWKGVRLLSPDGQGPPEGQVGTTAPQAGLRRGSHGSGTSDVSQHDCILTNPFSWEHRKE